MIKNNKDGFTLVELLIVIVIIMILIGLLMPALYGAKKQAKLKQAKVECIGVATAIIGYHADYRKWPVPDVDQEHDDIDYGRDSEAGEGQFDNNVVVDILAGSSHPYLDLGDFKTDANNNILDPWGKQYVIKIDNSYDGQLFPADKYNLIGKGGIPTNSAVVAVWSSGPDKMRGDYSSSNADKKEAVKDNIIVWK